jgi:hypothetical protein
VSLDPGDRVFRRIEYGLGTSEDLGCDVVFVDFIDCAREKLLSHESEQLRQSWPLGQRFENTLQFSAFRLGGLGVGVRRHHRNSRGFSIQISEILNDTNILHC